MVQRVVSADALTLLRWGGKYLEPLAVIGLPSEILEIQFDPEEHPRLREILNSPAPTRFEPGDPRPDPFDGWILGEENRSASVHACMGVRLEVSGQIVGLLTLDSIHPESFEDVELEVLKALGVLAAASLRTLNLIETLEARAERTGRVARQLVSEALSRGGGEILGESSLMQALRNEIRTVAATALTVLIQGETGTGKELVARTLHEQSDRIEHPLVYVNCAALPDSIAESELFGHRRGAFTGAEAHRIGRFELAHQGTLFLDEIGELPLSLQPKLLRALQEGEIQRVGEDRTRRVDVRVLAASNRDLVREVKEGRFRADLYHRLQVYPIRVPPLRERRVDIPLLTRHFLRRAQIQLGGLPFRLGPGVEGALEEAPWPGNVRELEHVVTRACLRARMRGDLNPTIVRLADLDLSAFEPSRVPRSEAMATVPEAELGLRERMDRVQRSWILEAVEKAQGNWAQAARILKLDRASLHRMAKRLGLK